MKRNEQRLYDFLLVKWEKLGKPTKWSISSGEIAKEFVMLKAKVKRERTFVEKHTSRQNVLRLLNKLEEQGTLHYESSEPKKPYITFKQDD